ncbi:hypothetical protein L218DRAFT_951183 [Marasmius fiardii PR-910]|nr:hypothetical protein L218DRAFT_951183 [Marasmius fiardii PR-910]
MLLSCFQCAENRKPELCNEQSVGGVHQCRLGETKNVIRLWFETTESDGELDENESGHRELHRYPDRNGSTLWRDKGTGSMECKEYNGPVSNLARWKKREGEFEKRLRCTQIKVDWSSSIVKIPKKSEKRTGQIRPHRDCDSGSTHLIIGLSTILHEPHQMNVWSGDNWGFALGRWGKKTRKTSQRVEREPFRIHENENPDVAKARWASSYK